MDSIRAQLVDEDSHKQHVAKRFQHVDGLLMPSQHQRYVVGQGSHSGCANRTSLNPFPTYVSSSSIFFTIWVSVASNEINFQTLNYEVYSVTKKTNSCGEKTGYLIGTTIYLLFDLIPSNINILVPSLIKFFYACCKEIFMLMSEAS